MELICGHPMKFYNLDRPRNDFAPVCHRPPHGGGRHMSGASVSYARQYQRDRKARTRGAERARRREAVLADPAASVAA